MLLAKQIPSSQHLLPCAKQRQHKYKALLTSIASVIPHRQPVSVPARGNLEEVIDSIDRFTGCPQIHPEFIADGAAACEIVQLVKTYKKKRITLKKQKPVRLCSPRLSPCGHFC